MKAVILAGGRGTRLRPLTCSLPKPMLPIMEKPVLHHLLELLQYYGIDEVAIAVEYLSTSIKDYFADGKEFGVTIHYFEERIPLGTAGAVNFAKSFCDETFLVISGDVITDFNLAEGLAFHHQHGGIGTIFAKKVEDPREYGVISLDAEGLVTEFEEKPCCSEFTSHLVNTGIYLFNHQIFDYIPDNQEWDISCQLIPALLAGNQSLYAYEATGYWKDVGTIEQYRQVHEDILQRKVQIQFPANWNTEHGIWMGRNVSIEEGAVINGPAYIGDWTVVRSGARVEASSVIGAHSEIQRNASISKSVIWQDSYIGEKTELRGAVIAEKNVLWNGTAVYENGVIGSSSILGAEVVIRPEVKIWPCKRIEQQSIIENSLMWGNQSLSLFQDDVIIGKANLEITPEFVVALAGVYKSLFNPQDEVVVSAELHPYTQLLKEVFIHSVRSGGMDILEEPAGLLPLLSVAVTAKDKRVAGIYFQMREDNVVLHCLDESGEQLAKERQYAFERSYKLGTFRHVPYDVIGKHHLIAFKHEFHNPMQLSGENRFFLYEIPCRTDAWISTKIHLTEGFLFKESEDKKALSLVGDNWGWVLLVYEQTDELAVLYANVKIPKLFLDAIRNKIQQYQRV